MVGSDKEIRAKASLILKESMELNMLLRFRGLTALEQELRGSSTSVRDIVYSELNGVSLDALNMLKRTGESR